MFDRKKAKADNEKRQQGDGPTNQRASGRRISAQTMKQLHKDVDKFEERCEELEIALGLDHQWEETDPEDVEALEYYRTRRYHLALDKLERLVVQRLMELQKCNYQGTSKCSIVRPRVSTV